MATSFWNAIGAGAHTVAALAVVLVLALAGRWLARSLRQPPVIGEIAAGLVGVPVLLAVAGDDGLAAALLPTHVSSALYWVGHVALILFLVGVGHELFHATGPAARGVGWVAVGALVVPLALGSAYAGWVLLTGDAGLRGSAHTAALVLMLAVALSVSAVPVLVRLLADRGNLHTPIGRQAVAVALLLDCAAWVLLVAATSLAEGEVERIVRPIALFAAGVIAAVVARRLFDRAAPSRFAARHPWLTTVLIAVAAFAAAGGMRLGGLTEIAGAVIVGAALPARKDSAARPAREDDAAPPAREDREDRAALPTREDRGALTAAVQRVSRAGWLGLPVFLVSTGLTVFVRDFHGVPWAATGLAILVAVTGKLLGAYAGARLGGLGGGTGVRLGVLLNTRGLTELVVLQAGYTAGILTSEMFLALLIMALATTAMTGPAYDLVERLDRRRQARLPEPAPAS